MMTVAEVAQRLGVSGARVRQFVAEGRLRSSRLGNFLVFREADVERFAGRERHNGRPALKREKR